MQRRRRQHGAQPGEAGRDAGQLARPLGTEDDGRGDTVEQTLIGRADARMVAQRGGVERHHRERLFLALLAPAQFGHRSGIARVAGEMETAQPLERDDPPGAQQGQGCRQRIAGQRLAGRVEQAQSRAAGRAAGGFGMKAAVGRRRVFGLARRAERKGGEAGLCPVVGNAPADGVARAAVRAGGEGVAPAAAGRVAEIGDAVGADRGIGADGGEHVASHAVADGETIAGDVGRLGLDGVDARQPRRLLRQASDEFGHFFAVDRNRHPGAVVAHPADEAKLVRQPPDVGTKADALNQAANA